MTLNDSSKATPVFSYGMFCNDQNQSPDLNSTERIFHLLKAKLKPQDQAGSEDRGSNGLADRQQEETQRLVMSMGPRLQAFVDYKGSPIQQRISTEKQQKAQKNAAIPTPFIRSGLFHFRSLPTWVRMPWQY